LAAVLAERLRGDFSRTRMLSVASFRNVVQPVKRSP
jgi:hypothetical protein